MDLRKSVADSPGQIRWHIQQTCKNSLTTEPSDCPLIDYIHNHLKGDVQGLALVRVQWFYAWAVRLASLSSGAPPNVRHQAHAAVDQHVAHMLQDIGLTNDSEGSDDDDPPSPFREEVRTIFRTFDSALGMVHDGNRTALGLALQLYLHAPTDDMTVFEVMTPVAVRRIETLCQDYWRKHGIGQPT